MRRRASSCSTRARPSARSIRCSICSCGRTRGRMVRRSSRHCTLICCSPGDAYVEAVAIEGEDGMQVRELYCLRPDRMRVVPGPDGWAEAYEYTAAGRTVRFDQSAPPAPPILHLTAFHPLDDHYGLAPLEAAAVAVDTHNSAARWNKALLDNSARPSGALVYAGPEGSLLSDGQFDRLK